MKLKKMLFSSIVLGSCLGFYTVGAFAADGGKVDSSVGAIFEAGGGTTSPVDPENPDTGITPIGPDGEDSTGGATAGPLTIDYASHFEFTNLAISSQDTVYYANPQKVKSTNAEEAEVKEKPNYVQVTDNRGTESGWTLRVKQNGQFEASRDNEKISLDGAQITINDIQVATASASPKPTDVSSSIALDINGAESKVMAAASGEGAGTYVAKFADSAGAFKESVALFVPGKSKKYASTRYSTTLTWILTDIPENQSQ